MIFQIASLKYQLIISIPYEAYSYGLFGKRTMNDFQKL